VGYAQAIQHLDGVTPAGRKVAPGIDGLQSEIELATRQLIKKQRTWFKNQSKKVPGSRWFELENDLPLLEESFTKEIF
jgi:tRNA A37 N6-isopentenylltransferase MiaA